MTVDSWVLHEFKDGKLGFTFNANGNRIQLSFNRDVARGIRDGLDDELEEVLE